ncbi:MAG: helix-turn-helix transcriptional regulator [Chitinophagaceae bacterium]
MSSNIRVSRICQYCQKEFEAKTTVTKTCSDYCAKRLYKQKQKASKIEASNTETQAVKLKPLEELKAKEFLTVKDLSKLLNCSTRTAYYLIEKGTIKAVNLAQRKTLVKRSEIDKLFS